MTSQVKTRAKAMAEQAVPWRQGVPWWTVLVEGLVALGVGIYLLVVPAAGAQILLILGGFLLVVGVVDVFNSLRGHVPPTISKYRMTRGGIAIVVGGLIVINAFAGWFSAATSATILSIGLVVTGAIGLVEWFVGRKEPSMGWLALVLPAAIALLGLLLLGSNMQMALMAINLIGVVGVVAGIGLLIYAYVLVNRAHKAQVAAAAEPVVVAPTAPAPARSDGADQSGAN
jgi:uncharacterized membrane protein HdeD (DUF308 family)